MGAVRLAPMRRRDFPSDRRTSVRVVEMTTTQMGAIAKAATTYHATELGIVVLGRGPPYDLVLDTGDLLVRTQCKWARRKGNVVVIRVRTCRHTPNGYVRGTCSASEVDGVAAWGPARVSALSLRSPTSTARTSCTCVWRPLGTTKSSLYTCPPTTGLGL